MHHHNHLHDKCPPIYHHPFRCYVSCDIRMDNIGNQLFGSPSTCGPDCFQITDSIISQVFEHMTKDRCPNVPAFNAISNITNPAVGSSTGTATYIICKTQLEEAASILFGMPVLNSQCLPPMGLLIPDNVGYAPTHSQYQVNLASVRYVRTYSNTHPFLIAIHIYVLFGWPKQIGL